MNGFFVSGEMFKDEQVLLDLDADDRGKILLLPPGTVIFREEFAFRGDQIETVDEALQAVLCHGDLLVKTPAMGDQRTQVSDMMRWHPDFRDDISNQ